MAQPEPRAIASATGGCPPQNGEGPEAAARDFYRRAIGTLDAAGLPFLVGGAYALERYTGIARHTKDLDIFVRPRDFEQVLDALAASGCQTEVTYRHWLGKAYCGEDFVDVIFSSGNAISNVDDQWFAHGVDGEVFGLPVSLCPAEEMIWSKAFIMERERFDGADIAHILRSRADDLDWDRLLGRFGSHWRVLLSHLVLFGFVYPHDRARIPARVMQTLIRRLRREMEETPPAERICQGTLLSRAQYVVDVECAGHQDARLAPIGNMTADETAVWTGDVETTGLPYASKEAEPPAA